MISIKLKKGETGYDTVERYIREYWKNHIYEDVIFNIGTSYDGQNYECRNEIASPYNLNDIEYLNDWWEGEQYITLYGIIGLSEIEVKEIK